MKASRITCFLLKNVCVKENPRHAFHVSAAWKAGGDFLYVMKVTCRRWRSLQVGFFPVQRND